MYNIGLILTPIEFGGAERVSLNLVKHIDQSKYKLFPILLIRPWEKKTVLATEIEKCGLSHFDIPVAIRPRNKGRDYFRVVRCLKRLLSIIREEEIDLLHTNGYFADILGIPISKILRIPIVTTCHGYINLDRKLKVYNKVDIFLIRFADRIISVSDNIRKELVKVRVDENKILMLENAVNLHDSENDASCKLEQIRRKYNINESDILIGYTGRISREKGLKYLVRAIEKVIPILQKQYSIKVIIIGDGPEKDAIQKEISNRNIKYNFILTGFQKNVSEFLQLMDIFILPSLTEGTPMALLEAMAHGIPIIATSVGGVPAIINTGINGILVPPYDPHAISIEIVRMAENKKYRKTIGLNAKKTIEQKYNVKKWIRRIEQAYLSVLAR